MPDYDDWEILEGPTEVDPEGKDARVFRFRYRSGEAQQNATVILSGSMLASLGHPWSSPFLSIWRARSALVEALKKGRRPESITVFSDGRIIEYPPFDDPS
jgi:hypothetical protein